MPNVFKMRHRIALQSRTRRREAFTLIEMVLTFSAGSSLLLLAVTLVHQAMSLSKNSTRRAEQDRALARLEHDFRGDVHMATSAELNAEGFLSLECSDDLQVTYRFVDDRVIRECRKASGNDQPANDPVKPTSADVLMTEQYKLDSESRVSFSALTMPQRAEMTVVRRLPNSGGETRVDAHLLSLVGKWHRIEVSKGQTE